MSWIAGTAGSGFDTDNLPLGIFVADGRARPGVAIGPFVCDLDALVRGELLDEPSLAGAQTLNAFLAAGRARWSALRTRLQTLFTDVSGEEQAAIEEALIPRADVRMQTADRRARLRRFLFLDRTRDERREAVPS